MPGSRNDGRSDVGATADRQDSSTLVSERAAARDAAPRTCPGRCGRGARPGNAATLRCRSDARRQSWRASVHEWLRLARHLPASWRDHVCLGSPSRPGRAGERGILFRAVTHGHFRLLLSGWPSERGTLFRAFTHGYFYAPHELGRITR
jgi:hypothetical protein